MKMRIYTSYILLILLPSVSFCQGGIWTWVNGSNAVDPVVNYGTIGVASPSNTPSGLA